MTVLQNKYILRLCFKIKDIVLFRSYHFSVQVTFEFCSDITITIGRESLTPDSPKNQICRTVGPSFTTSLEPLAHCWNVASLSLFCRYYFGRCSSDQAQQVPFCYSWERLLIILIDSMIFLSPFLDSWMSMSTVSFLAQLYSGILCLQNAFLLPMI